MVTATQEKREGVNKPSVPVTYKNARAQSILIDLEQFLYAQASLLDDKRWFDYIDLFCPDGLYWMPTARHYTTWEGQPTIFIEDRDLMSVRAKRMGHPRAWSQAAEWQTEHLISNVILESLDETSGDVHVSSRYHMSELRRDDLRHFSGRYHHHLKMTDDGFRIKLQRVDLMNSQAPFEYVLQAWV
jgi:3-phenylpropionate/cinnamic acid dioxygenase small subunit